jgi:hypothetical protein
MTDPEAKLERKRTLEPKRKAAILAKQMTEKKPEQTPREKIARLAGHVSRRI